MSSLSSARKRYKAAHPSADKTTDWPRCPKCLKQDEVVHSGDGHPQCMRCGVRFKRVTPESIINISLCEVIP